MHDLVAFESATKNMHLPVIIWLRSCNPRRSVQWLASSGICLPPSIVFDSTVCNFSYYDIFPTFQLRTYNKIKTRFQQERKKTISYEVEAKQQNPNVCVINIHIFYHLETNATKTKREWIKEDKASISNYNLTFLARD